MSLATDLIEQALHLARRERHKPRQASLRRSVSSAYYALFHLIVGEAAGLLARGTSRRHLRHVLARSLDHADIRHAASSFLSGSPPRAFRAAFEYESVSRELKSVAGTFADLMERRHEADYHPGRKSTRNECLDNVDRAAVAFRDWEKVRGTPEAEAFLVAAFTSRRIRG